MSNRKEEANFVLRTLLMEHYLQISRSILFKGKWTHIQSHTVVYTVYLKQVYHHYHQ